MARAIDANEVLRIFKLWIDTKQVEGEELKAVETCIAVIEDMPTLTSPNEWVRVEERLPEVDDSVLVYVIDTFNIKGNIVITKYTIGLNSKMEWLGFEHNSFKVTHWMPLPEPPSEMEKRLRG